MGHALQCESGSVWGPVDKQLDGVNLSCLPGYPQPDSPPPTPPMYWLRGQAQPILIRLAGPTSRSALPWLCPAIFTMKQRPGWIPGHTLGICPGPSTLGLSLSTTMPHSQYCNLLHWKPFPLQNASTSFENLTQPWGPSRTSLPSLQSLSQ